MGSKTTLQETVQGSILLYELQLIERPLPESWLPLVS